MTDIANTPRAEAEKTAPDGSLPRPARTRWQPLRCGLLNLFRFDRVEFPFADGRLLLRGNNGSGKSRVLALQLPFLLDGETASHRVEPDGDPAKRMEWNLLMGEHEERLGYTWIEFGRKDEHGAEHYLTLGCGLRATRGRGVHAKWLFTTPLRHGRDFELHNSQNQPLTQEKLAEVLGERGSIHRQAREYRKAVNEQLFKLGGRYEALLELLIRLRQPKLSEKLDESVLSNALSEALTPLPATLITEVAESFRGLEADRDELTGFERARDAVADFLEDYRLYVQVAARRRAEAVRRTHSEYETHQRKQREAEEALARAETERDTLESEKNSIETKLTTTRQAIRTLRESPEMRSAEAIDHARREAERTENEAERHAADTEHAETKHRQAGTDHEKNKAASEEAAGKANEALADARTQANQAGLSREHNEAFPRPAEDGAPELSPDWSAIRRKLESTLTDRREAIRIVEAKNRLVAEADAHRQQTETDHGKAADALGEAKAGLREAEQALDTAAEKQFDTYRQWAAATVELRPAEAETLADAWEHWLDRLEGDSPLVRARDEAHASHIRSCQAERTRMEEERETLQAEISEAREEIQRLEEGAQKPPEAPVTRPADRTGRPGAPFWMVCDFHEGITDNDRAGIEAALQASGLLDAWVLPDGAVIDPATEDAFLLPKAEAAPAVPVGASLGRYLKPCIDTLDANGHGSPSGESIEALLNRIGSNPDSGSYWISNDGSYRLGPLQGKWSKPEAEYIGESSRAAARKRRIESLRSEIKEKEGSVQKLTRRLHDLAQREATARAEAEAAPTDTAIRELGYRAATARNEVIHATDAEQRTREKAEAAAKKYSEALGDRDREAGDLRLSEWVERLDTLRDHLNNYDKTLAALWPTLDNLRRARAHAEEARLRLEQATRDLEQQKERLHAARQSAAAARQHYATLEETSGKEAREILAKLKKTEEAEKALVAEGKTNEERRIQSHATMARADEHLKNLKAALDHCIEEREKAVRAFQRFTSERLLADAHEQLAAAETDIGSVSRAVDLARRTDQLLAGVNADDESWNQQQQAIHHQIEQLRDNLVPQGHSPDTRSMDDLLIVRVPFRGTDCSASELHAALCAEIEDRRRLLDEKERTVIENHLLSETATEIQRLLREAEEWVRETNRELENRPTSTGMRLRFVWEPDPEGPPGLEAARNQLRQRSELWSEEQRVGLAQFFQQRIEAERIENRSASWPDLLSNALDYRRWHRFSIERQQNNQWKRLTRRTHGTGSGGEKAIALTIPQFAAAAAHYRSAAPEAPRLILLDEVFVGIDSEMRSNCMGLLSQFDLDFMMTSEREWGCYPSLQALSICHLTTRPGFDAIAVTRWTWNGRERQRSSS